MRRNPNRLKGTRVNNKKLLSTLLKHKSQQIQYGGVNSTVIKRYQCKYCISEKLKYLISINPMRRNLNKLKCTRVDIYAYTYFEQNINFNKSHAKEAK
jgi:hypothetical protein